MKTLDYVVATVCLLFIGICLGYGWRMMHELKKVSLSVTRHEVIKEVMKEAESGYTFIYCGYKVVPRKDGGVTIK